MPRQVEALLAGMGPVPTEVLWTVLDVDCVNGLDLISVEV